MKIISKFIQSICSKTALTKKAYSQYADVSNLFKVGRRAGRIYKHQNKFSSIFTGIGSVRKKVGYFPLVTAAASGAAGYYFVPFIPGPTAIGLVGGLALKSGAKSLFRFFC